MFLIRVVVVSLLPLKIKKDFTQFPYWNGNIYSTVEELDAYYLDEYSYFSDEGNCKTMDGLYGLIPHLCRCEFDKFIIYRKCVEYIQKGYSVYIKSFDRDYDEDLIESIPICKGEDIILILQKTE